MSDEAEQRSNARVLGRAHISGGGSISATLMAGPAAAAAAVVATGIATLPPAPDSALHVQPHHENLAEGAAVFGLAGAALIVAVRFLLAELIRQRCDAFASAPGRNSR